MPCTVCHHLIEGPELLDRATGNAFHPACAVEQVPAELAALSLELAASFLVPFVLRWAA
jgi:hypothetical protein